MYTHTPREVDMHKFRFTYTQRNMNYHRDQQNNNKPTMNCKPTNFEIQINYAHMITLYNIKFINYV